MAKHLNGVVNIVIKRLSGEGNPGSEDGEIAPRESQDIFQPINQKDEALQIEEKNTGGRPGTATYVNPKKDT